MIILASDRQVVLTHNRVGTIHVKFTTDLNAHARLCNIPAQELESLLNKMVDDLIPKIESLADKYYKGYSE